MAEKLGRSEPSIKSLMRRLSFKNTKENTFAKQQRYNRKTSGEFTVNEKLFTQNINKYTSYLLGFLWADGYLNITRKDEFIKKCRINVSVKYIDGEYLGSILERTGKWSFWINKSSKYPQHTFHCANTILCQFLEDNNYQNKSFMSPTKILLKIPTKYHKYFYLGYLDGDGCIYVKNNNCRVIFTSTIKQDWTFLKILCEKLECKFHIRRLSRKNRNSKFSDVSIYGRKNCLKLLNYIYSGHNLGFPRKRQKYNSINKLK